MMRDYRAGHYATLFSDGIEPDAPASQTERRRKRTALLRESAGRKFARFCADLNHVLNSRAIMGLPGTIDFLMREKSIGAAGLPDPRHSRQVPNGLAGLADDLSPAAIVEAYSEGLFLRWMLGQATFWAPEGRLVIEPDEISEPPDLVALLASGDFRVTLDRDFDEVVNAVSADSIRKRLPYCPSGRGMNAFGAAHDAGFAHSLEIRNTNGVLAGGVYGIACGRMFVMQGRFGFNADIADIAVLALNRHLQEWGFRMLDGCVDESLASLGFRELARETHLARIPRSLSGGRPGRWLASPALTGQPARVNNAI